MQGNVSTASADQNRRGTPVNAVQFSSGQLAEHRGRRVADIISYGCYNCLKDEYDKPRKLRISTFFACHEATPRNSHLIC